MFQQRDATQRTTILESAPVAVKCTEFFQSANAYFARRKDKTIFWDRDYVIPVYFLVLTVVFWSVLSFLGPSIFASDGPTSYVWGGVYAIGGKMSGPDLAKYQSSTLFVVSVAFLVSYYRIISGLIGRINNNDIRPSMYHFFTVRIMKSCLLAIAARHVVEALPDMGNVLNKSAGDYPVGLAALGFAIGWDSKWASTALLHAIRNFLGWQSKNQREVDPNHLPQNMSLLEIQGMVEEKIERLSEIDVDNCQKLAEENPVIIWVRTLYTLEVVIDWIGQAQLCVLFEAATVAVLRNLGVRDIFCYLDVISCPEACAAIHDATKIPVALLKQHVTSIRSDPSFLRLDQLRDSLRPS
ncbi:MAG: hypothetical protein EXR07_06625 [Acetobacteraceae bacterium]|nr:hypothetical protein [Acetobacteraceae bacterium]